MTKMSAEYMREYRKNRFPKAGAGPEPQGQGVPAVRLPRPTSHVELGSHGQIAVLNEQIAVLTEVHEHAHDACDERYAELEDRFYTKDRVLRTAIEARDRLQIRVDYLERKAGQRDDERPEKFDDVRMIVEHDDLMGVFG